MNYRETVETLFKLLALANLADSDSKQNWQEAGDSMNRPGKLYGELRHAIQSIAGEAIIEHWAETGELVMKLASRIPQTWLLYDSDTLEVVRIATDAEIERSLDAGPTGHITVSDYSGRVFAQRR